MIHLIIGRQGSGKTLFLVKVAYEAYRSGRKVYSNVHLKFPYKPIDYNDIVNYKYHNAVVIIDEIHAFLPARSSMRKINQKVVYGFLSMVRKRDLEVYATTQHAFKVDKGYREEKDYYYRCSRWAYINDIWHETRHNKKLPPETPVMIKLDVIEMFEMEEISFSFIANPYYNLYDSSQIIEIKGLEGTT